MEVKRKRDALSPLSITSETNKKADLLLIFNFRCLDNPFRFDRGSQNLLRHHPRRLAGNIMDSYQHQLHVRFFPNVSLGAWHSV